MFDRLGSSIARHPRQVILAWLVLVVVARFFAPAWDDVTHDGDFAYLPADMPSVRGERLYRQAFPEQRAKSQIVIVLAREDDSFGRRDAEFAKRIELALHRRMPEERPHSEEGPVAATGGAPRDNQFSLPIVDVWTCNDDYIGEMFRSRGAGLIVLRLSTELMAVENRSVLAAIRSELARLDPHRPEGLKVGITGSAAIGADMLDSAAESIRNTEVLTVTLVVVILLLVYRAPLMLIVPLASIFVSVVVATSLIAALTQLDRLPGFDWWNFKIFRTTKIFVVVILYGAGTDFCLFLIARYKEELAAGGEARQAAGRALGKVGRALSASALTTIVGLAMMYFADFGKFSNSGPAIALCLFVALAACCTLAPALLAALGPALFWPFAVTQGKSLDAASRPAPQGTTRLANVIWNRLAQVTTTYPATILAISLLLLAPLAYRGLGAQNDTTYDLLGELSPERTSVQGTRLLSRHFSVGETGPIHVLAYAPDKQLDSEAGKDAIAELTRELYDLEGVANVRSLTQPMGSGSFNFFRLDNLRKLMAGNHPLAQKSYLSRHPPQAHHVARFQVVLGSKPKAEETWSGNPFSAAALTRLAAMRELLDEKAAAPGSYWTGVQFEIAGTTAAIDDLREVTGRDRRRIQLLVVLAVFAVLLAILRRPVVSVYLVLTVLFSYLVTLGAAQLYFRWLYGETYYGLDWKVPIFLFVILVAVGQDYNIYLVTRVFEEQRRADAISGLRRAIVRTGGIITSCGVIMAGTFISMTAGTLRGMLELGFALSLGILLDTLFVRTVLVPAFLTLYARFLGDSPQQPRPA